MSRIDPRNPIYRKIVAQNIANAIAQDVRNLMQAAEMQAWASDHTANILNTAGRLLFITLGAAEAQGFTSDSPDIRIMLGMGSALGDLQADGDVERHRPAIQAGLMAVGRVMPHLTPANVFMAAEALDCALKQGEVGMAQMVPAAWRAA